MKALNSILILLSLSFSTAGFANDSASSVEGGNLVFKKSDNIRMLKENLFISTSRVSVEYQFLNESSAPIRTLVSFPIPPVEQCSVSYTGQPSAFQTVVNGKPVKVKLSTRLIKKGQTADDCQTTQSIYTWSQVFPPHQVVNIVHIYSPGNSGAIISLRDTVADRLSLLPIDGECFSESNVAFEFQYWWRNQLDKAPETFRQDVGYIWTTGNNWKNGIEDFTLTVDKGNEDNKLAVCGISGLTKISPTLMRVNIKNFRPQNEFRMTLYPFPRP